MPYSHRGQGKEGRGSYKSIPLSGLGRRPIETPTKKELLNGTGTEKEQGHQGWACWNLKKEQHAKPAIEKSQTRLDHKHPTCTKAVRGGSKKEIAGQRKRRGCSNQRSQTNKRNTTQYRYIPKIEVPTRKTLLHQDKATGKRDKKDQRPARVLTKGRVKQRRTPAGMEARSPAHVGEPRKGTVTVGKAHSNKGATPR